MARGGGVWNSGAACCGGSGRLPSGSKPGPGEEAETTTLDLASLGAGWPDASVALDELTATELRSALPEGALASVDGDVALIRWSLDAGEVSGSPLAAVAQSLQNHAGGPLEALACLEIALDRHGGRLEIAGAEVHVRLPLSGALA